MSSVVKFHSIITTSLEESINMPYRDYTNPVASDYSNYLTD